METVTLGVVGDTFVGKTLLLVSFTGNYVFKEYRPTVLNCCWTNLVVDGVVVDLTIWDNTGKASLNLSLVCYRIRMRCSFVYSLLLLTFSMLGKKVSRRHFLPLPEKIDLHSSCK